MSKNIAAILDYVKKTRPNDLNRFEQIMEMERRHDARGTAMMLLLVVGFEAGREFQEKNPSMPLGSGAHYLSA